MIFLWFFFLSVILGQSPANSEYIKSPLYDQDKASFTNPNDLSCGLASAANMLAAAGYASGDSQTIYDRMIAHYGLNNPQFQDDALDWYIDNYGEAGNPYTVISYYIDDAHLNPDFFLQELMRCQYVGIAIEWNGDATHSEGAHALTLWGDNEVDDPNHYGYFSDSDRDDGDNYTWYRWIDLGGGDWGLDDYYDWTDVDIYYAATLCSQVPEPCSMLLIGSGLLCLAGLRRKFQKE